MSSSGNRVFRLLLYRLLRSQRHCLTRPLRIKATLLYVRAVQVVRCSVMSVLGLCVVCLFLFTGLALFHLGLFLYLPGSLAEKGCIFMWLGGGYIVAMSLLCAFALSQKKWMKMTGADKAVLRALEP